MVAAAVLGVLQPVAVVEELADPLRNQGHGVTLACRVWRTWSSPRRAPSECARVVDRRRQESGSGTGHSELGAAPARRVPRPRGLPLRRRGAGDRPRHRGDGRLVPGRRSRRRRGPGGAEAPMAAWSWWPSRSPSRSPTSRWAVRLGVAALLGLADSAEVVLVATLVMRFIGRRMRDVQDAWRLFAIAAAGAITAGLLISLVYWRMLDSSVLGHARAGRALARRGGPPADTTGAARPSGPWPHRWAFAASSSWRSARCWPRPPCSRWHRAGHPGLCPAARAGVGRGPLQRLGRGHRAARSSPRRSRC